MKIYDYDNLDISGSTRCQECGQYISWCDKDDDGFCGILDKLVYHINNDTQCVRERKLKILLGTKERLAQDHWLLKY